METYNEKKLIELIGCCGANCGTCKILTEKTCKGCKLGYLNGERDINKAKCKIKICCINHNYSTCADCDKYSECEIIQSFHNKNGHKYKKYKEAIKFILDNGYSDFIKVTRGWGMQYGEFKTDKN